MKIGNLYVIASVNHATHTLEFYRAERVDTVANFTELIKRSDPDGTKLSYICMNPGHEPGAASNDTP
jgi:hypothetical protein